MIGLYIHIPFCAIKCDYCDFYSLKYNRELVKEYVEEMCRRLKNINLIFDTVYFGGGTPSIIGAENLSKILSCVNYKSDAEITVEVNPRSYKKDFFNVLYENGFNRISIGLQSAVAEELKFLTRNHTAADVIETVNAAKKSGFNNISLDIMLGVEKQTIASLKKTLDFCLNLNVAHLSCYMLKVEEGTPFYKQKLDLPNDDIVSDMYSFMCEYLNSNGYNQYEISNFSREGMESRHNLLYWKCENYLGLGPAAHSFLNGKRYYFPNDINYFIEGNDFIFSEEGGDLFDYIMLGLRLKEGISLNQLKDKGFSFNKNIIEKFKKYQKLGFLNMNNDSISLTVKGFLIQNTILCDILEEI